MQDRSDSPIEKKLDGKPFVSTRHRDAEPDRFDPKQPRLGRRESEPHSAEITYLYDVLTTNFPEDRTMWDLHHYFKKEGLDIDIQFDISFFKGLKIPHTLTSYQADKFNNKVPTAAINILSRSTWRSDLAEKIDFSRLLEIPLYIVFPSYHVAINLYKPPLVRAYVLQDDGKYQIHELRKITVSSSRGWDSDAIIDVSEIVPFRLGLRKREQIHQDDEPLYRLILIKPNKDELFLTESETKNEIIDEQRQKIAQKDQKIDEQRQKIAQQDQKINEIYKKVQRLENKQRNFEVKK